MDLGEKIVSHEKLSFVMNKRVNPSPNSIAAQPTQNTRSPSAAQP
jgi:hypothetical protein